MVQPMSDHLGLGSMITPVVAIAATGILISSFAVIVRMSPKTNHWIRAFYTTISAGAFGELIRAISGEPVSLSEAILIMGIGALFLFDRRAVCRSRHADCRERGNHEAV